MSKSSYTGNVAAPTIKSVKSVGSSKVRLTWSRVATACGYQIYYADSKNGSYKKLKTVKGAADHFIYCLRACAGKKLLF